MAYLISLRSRGLERLQPANLDDLPLPELFEHHLGEGFWRGLAGVELELGILGRLVERIDTGEIGDEAGAGLAVEPLGIALLAHFKRRIDIDLDELSLLEQIPRHAPLGAERRDERDHDDKASIDEQSRRFGHAADILHPVGVGEAEILVETVADIVAVEHISVAPHGVEPPLKRISDGRLPSTGEAGEP